MHPLVVLGGADKGVSILGRTRSRQVLARADAGKLRAWPMRRPRAVTMRGGACCVSDLAVVQRVSQEALGGGGDRTRTFVACSAPILGAARRSTFCATVSASPYGV